MTKIVNMASSSQMKKHTAQFLWDLGEAFLRLAAKITGKQSPELLSAALVDLQSVEEDRRERAIGITGR